MIHTEVDWSECSIIQRDPAKLHGAPTIRGLRITPDAILENFEEGLNVSEIHDQFPSVPTTDIQAVLEFAIGRGYVEGPVR